MTVKIRLTNIILLIIVITIAISLMGTSVSYARDGSEYYNYDSSPVFSPGYLNAAKHESDLVLKQQAQVSKSLFSNLVEFVQGTIGAIIKTHKNEEDGVKPVLQQKTSGGNKPKIITAGSTFGNVNIGGGTNQERDANGRLLAEWFGNVRCVYAGFDNVGSSLQVALSLAKAGDNIICKSGTYDLSGLTAGLFLGGINMYGGYNENGVRDISNTPTVLTLDWKVELWAGVNNTGNWGYPSSQLPSVIDGFTFSGPNALHVNDSSSLTLSHNVFDTGLVINNSSVTLMNNTFNNDGVSLEGAWMFNSTQSHVISLNNNYNCPYAVNDINGYGASTFESTNDYFMGDALPPLIGGINPNNPGVVTATVINPITNPNSLYTTANDSAITNYEPYTSGLSLTLNKDDNSLSDQQKLFDKSIKDGYDNNTGGAILRSMIVPKNPTQADPALMAKFLEEPLSSSALSIPLGGPSAESIDMAAKLANIVKSPTEDQKAVLDAVKALLTDISTVSKKEARNESANSQLKKAEDDLLNIVANVLLAQAIPDLMNKGDMANVKTIFFDLGIAKGRILSDYEKSTKSYYENVAKDLAKNMTALQLGNVLTPQLTREELDKLPRSELDKILEKIRKRQAKTFEEDYILQQEAKYRTAYLEAGKKKFEEEMKNMIEDFTDKISKMLKTSDKK